MPPPPPPPPRALSSFRTFPKPLEKVPQNSEELVAPRDQESLRSPKDSRHQEYRANSTAGSSKPSPPLFTVDRRGDRENLRYERLDRSTVPKYERFSADGIAKDRSGTGKRRRPAPVPDHAPRDPDPGSGTRWWLELHQNMQRQPPQSIQEGLSQQNVATEGFVSVGRDIKPDGSKLRPDDTAESFEKDEWILRQQHFNAHLQKNPQDINQWLAFVQFQEEFLRGQQAIVLRDRNSGIRERKLAILERGLETNPRNLRLLRVQMSILAQVMDVQELEQKWSNVLAQAEDTAEDVQLWLEYLNFYQSQSSGFCYTRCRTKYTQAMDRAKQSKDTKGCVMLLQRLVSLEIQSGYQERAWGVVVALLEINLFSPSPQSYSENMDAFRRYWNSSLPILGESEARGWCRAEKKKEPVASPYPVEAEVASRTTSDPFLWWVQDECYQEARYLFPERRDAEPTDPERVVLFEDLEPFLMPLDPLQLHCLLLHLLRTMFELPLPFGQDLEDFDSFLWDCPDRFCVRPMYILHLLQDPILDRPLADLNERVRIHEDCIRNLFETLLEATDMRSLLLPYYFLFESMLDAKAASKKAKEFLRNDDQDVQLWILYALIESYREKTKEAKRVCKSILAMRTSLPLKERTHLDTVLLLNCELHIRLSEWKEAATLLCAEALGENSDKEFVLTESKWQEAYSMSERRILASDKVTMENMFCHAWLVYLMNAETDPLGKSLRELELLPHPRDSFTKVLWQTQKAKMMILDQTSGGYKPEILRSHLEQSVLAHGVWCVYFLPLYAQKEAAFKVENRLRQTMDQLRTKFGDVWYLVWFRVQLEWKEMRVHASRVLELYENALERHGHCVLLWQSFISFVLSLGDKGRSVFYRAVQACPWHKRIQVTLACQPPLRQELEENELEALLQRALQAELRLRTLPPFMQ